jgi:hypothetical protein
MFVILGFDAGIAAVPVAMRRIWEKTAMLH